MHFIAAAFALLFLVLPCFPVGASERDADCPLVHPENALLKLYGFTLDQDTKGTPRPPDGDELINLPDGATRIVTHYASYEILRNAIVICSYGEVVNRRYVNTESTRHLRIPLPGILMRCESITRDWKSPEWSEWIRGWCTHDPDE